ncbi:MAG TPA: Ig-like domain-containing protein [Solimonas sp.]|nr:Ig-like domain-containing protein [Solimonas sp.]
MNQVKKHSAAWLIPLLLGALAAGCGGDGGRDPVLGTGGIAVRAPTVTAVTPLDNATDIAIDKTSITATFDEPVNPINGGASFTVTCAAPCTNPTGTVSLDSTNTVATFTLTPGTSLQAQTSYTGTVTGATSRATGQAMQAPFVWNFTTGSRPQVTVTVPATATPPVDDVPGTTPITATFTKDMAPATILAAGTFTLSCAAPCAAPAGTVSYDAATRTARFTPAAPLAAGETFTATITTAAEDTTGTALAGNQAPLPAASNYVWSFTTQAPPTVTAVTPVNNATAVTTVGTIVNAAFSETMAPLTGAETFTLTCAAPCTNPTGTFALNASRRIATFTVTGGDLDTLTRYTATVAGFSSSATGLPMAGPFVWRFTTGAGPDTTRPRVTVTEPATTSPGPTPGVATNAAISAAFTEDMNPGTIGAGTFTVTCAAPCASPAGTVSYDVGSRTAVFAHAALLDASTTYTATITTGARDLAGNALAGNQAPLPAASDYVWTFTTGAAADTTAPTVTSINPVDGTTGVCPNKTVNAKFSEAMDPSSITTSTFRLRITGGAPVSGVVAYDAPTRIASFNPTSDLIGSPATQYTVTIRGGASGVRDLAGNTLAADRVTTFTTGTAGCNAAPPLGAAAPFGAFGGNATLTNDGLNTVINGDIGVNAASTTVTGFTDSGGNVYTITPNNNGLVNGLVYTLTAPPGSVAGAAVTQARSDAQVAFDSISPGAMPGGIDVSSLAQCPSCGGAGGGPDELAGRTLPPGVYLSSTGTYDIGGPGRTTANLTLDAGGDANAVWIFQTAAGTGTLNVGLTGPATPAVPIKVLLVNGAQPRNVFWFVPGGAVIGTGSSMVGTMLSDAAITISTTGGSPPTAVLTTIDGRAISLTAGVTMTNTVINVPAP